MIIRIRAAVAAILPSILLIGCAPKTDATVEETAFSLLKQHHVNAAKIDWDSLHNVVVAGNTAMTLEQKMATLVRATGEPHTTWISAERAKEVSFLQFNATQVDEATRAIRSSLSEGVATVTVPPFSMAHERAATAFADALQQTVETLAEHGPKYWVVDLRDNWGGNMWPMLAGLTCLLPTTELGSLKESSGLRTGWRVVEGAAIGGDPNGRSIAELRRFKAELWNKEDWSSDATIYASTSRACKYSLHSERLVVLVGPVTASSGEAIAISFLARPNTRIAGERTRGFATGNRPFTLRDGSLLFVTKSYMADADGRTFSGGIDPSELGAQGRRFTGEASAARLASLFEKTP